MRMVNTVVFTGFQCVTREGVAMLCEILRAFMNALNEAHVRGSEGPMVSRSKSLDKGRWASMAMHEWRRARESSPRMQGGKLRTSQLKLSRIKTNHCIARVGVINGLFSACEGLCCTYIRNTHLRNVIDYASAPSWSCGTLTACATLIRVQ